MDFYAMHLEAAQIVRDLCKLPAPSHHEELRAEYCKNWFENNGFENVVIDEALNVIAPVNVSADNEVSVLMAHTDTVFPDTEPMPFVEKEGFMYSPGVTDDTANLAVLMVCAREFKKSWKSADGSGLLFVANSCEEGLGNLKGCRKIVETYGKRMRELVSLDSSMFGYFTDKAVGSHRYKVQLRTEGGHSFSRFGNRNAIHHLASLITMLYTVKVPVEGDSKTTYNVGTISGGTSVNTIAQDAEMLYEYRSDNPTVWQKCRRYLSLRSPQSVPPAWKLMWKKSATAPAPEKLIRYALKLSVNASVLPARRCWIWNTNPVPVQLTAIFPSLAGSPLSASACAAVPAHIPERKNWKSPV